MPMGRLSSDQVLRDNRASDAASISALKLNQKALSDVSCLRDFKNLQRLDLGFNSLTSLEDLKPRANLKWLSVVQNKLRSLKGVEALSNLTVLNAGKNKLTSMDEVQSLVGLRALILNDNEITSICKLDQMKELNTLVLSRNPITDIGKSLVKVKSLTKLSLSNCQLEAIDSSLRSCIELKELRLAHNNIQILPSELAQNTKLQSLDLGNNLITRWSDVKVLKSLVNLKNLNLQGNPIAENEKLAKKIRKALPNLQIFNAKPVNTSSRDELRNIEAVDDFSFEQTAKEVKQKGSVWVTTKLKHQSLAKETLAKEKSKGGDWGDTDLLEKDRKRKLQKSPREVAETVEKKGKKKLKENLNNETVEKKGSKKSKEKLNSEIDDAEAAFSELFQAGSRGDARAGMEEEEIKNTLKQASAAGEPVTLPTRKKKRKKMSFDPSALGSSTMEVGMGGPSSWDN